MCLNGKIIDNALQSFSLDSMSQTFVHVYINICIYMHVCIHMLSLFKSFPNGEICFQFFSEVNDTTVNTTEFTVIHTLCGWVCVCTPRYFCGKERSDQKSNDL